MTTRGIIGLALVAAVGIAACTNPDRPSVQPQEVALPTPLTSPTAAISVTVDRLEAAVASVPTRLVEPLSPYRPSEPESLLQTPRVVLRADLAEPDIGHVLIYAAGREAEAEAQAAELARYLGSGFGQTNFPVDAQFSVATDATNIIFTWWSRRSSPDPGRAEAVFDAIAAVGEPVAVRK